MRWPRWLAPAPHWLWWIPAGAMVLVAAIAFALPTFLHQDHDPNGVSESDLDGLRVHTSWLKIRPVWTQVTEAHPARDNPRRIDGEVVGRTLFGVEVVRVRVAGPSQPVSDLDYQSGFIALAVFAGAMLVLGSLALVAIWKSE